MWLSPRALRASSDDVRRKKGEGDERCANDQGNRDQAQEGWGDGIVGCGSNGRSGAASAALREEAVCADEPVLLRIRQREVALGARLGELRRELVGAVGLVVCVLPLAV